MKTEYIETCIHDAITCGPSYASNATKARAELTELKRLAEIGRRSQLIGSLEEYKKLLSDDFKARQAESNKWREYNKEREDRIDAHYSRQTLALESIAASLKKEPTK